jgi:hypothetical protein
MSEINITKAEKILNFIKSSGEDGVTIIALMNFISEQNTKKGSICKPMYREQINKLVYSFCKTEINQYGIRVLKIVSPIAPPFYPPDKLLNDRKCLFAIRAKNEVLRKFDLFDNGF